MDGRICFFSKYPAQVPIQANDATYWDKRTYDWFIGSKHPRTSVPLSTTVVDNIRCESLVMSKRYYDAKTPLCYLVAKDQGASAITLLIESCNPNKEYYADITSIQVTSDYSTGNHGYRISRRTVVDDNDYACFYDRKHENLSMLEFYEQLNIGDVREQSWLLLNDIAPKTLTQSKLNHLLSEDDFQDNYFGLQTQKNNHSTLSLFSPCKRSPSMMNAKKWLLSRCCEAEICQPRDINTSLEEKPLKTFYYRESADTQYTNARSMS